MTGERLMTRNFVLATLAGLFLTMVFFVYFTGMSLYIIDGLGETTTTAGVLTGIFVVGDIVSRLACAPKIQQWGLRRSAVAFIAAGTGVSLLYFVTGSVPALAALMLVHGFTYGVAETAIYTMVISEIPDSRRGEGIGYFTLSNTFASILGPFISITMQNSGMYSAMFAFGTLSSAAALVLMLLSRELPLEPAPEKGFRWSDHIERSALRASFVMFLFFFTYSGVLAFVAPYSDEIGIGWYGSVFFIAVSAATLICRLFFGKVYDRHGENAALLPPLIMYTAGMFMVATVLNGPELLLAGFMMGTMVAMLNTVSQALVVRNVDRSRYGVAISTLSIFWDMSYAIGPMVHGAIVAAYGYSSDYMIMGCVAAAGIVIYAVLVGIPGRGYRRDAGKG